MSREPEWWSWSRILREIRNLGIPHFQRGQVWGSGNRVALLESMYEASPCGSFVLWQPEGDHPWGRIGVSLIGGCDVGAQTKWLVDGQQRTRALLSVYRQMLLAEQDKNSPRLLGSDVLDEIQSWMTETEQIMAEEEENDDGEQHAQLPTWYAVLPALESLKEIFGEWAESAHVLRGSQFRQLHPKNRKVQRVPHPRGMVPLAVLVARHSGPFASLQCRQEVLQALEPDRRDNGTLNRLVPWGPQFLNGYTYEGDSGHQIGWESISGEDASKLHRLLTSGAQELARFREMMDGFRFAVGELPRKGLGMAIRAYVRINRAGVRVQPEEEALALLTRWDDRILDYLGSFCRRRDKSNENVEDLRALLMHEADRQMGFQLWMSTVMRYVALFSMAKSARHWMGVSAIDKQTFCGELEIWPNRERTFQDQQALIEEAAQRASNALLVLDSILSEDLKLDHRMPRRDTRSLQPLLELLSHISQADIAVLLEDQHLRGAIARVLHITMLHSYIDGGEMSGLCDAIHGDAEQYKDGKWNDWGIRSCSGLADPGSAFGEALRRYMSALHAVWMRERERNGWATLGESRVAATGQRVLEDLQAWGLEQFSRDVDSATSLQSSAVGWLYAIERRAGACELNWSVQVEAFKADESESTGIKNTEAAQNVSMKLEAYRDKPNLHPEKQHIVPFSMAKKIAGKGGSRTTASVANAIGNLTWISARQNGFATGFSDRWSVFNEQQDVDNLQARGMLAEHTDGDNRNGLRAIDLYDQIRELVSLSQNAKAEEWPGIFGTLFDDFRKVRTVWMKALMKEWIEEPLNDAMTWLVEPRRNTIT